MRENAPVAIVKWTINFILIILYPYKKNGTNELSNLQALCIGCQMAKTHNEQQNGQFVKFTDTESTFNNQVQEIMSSILSSSLAFVERLHKTHIEETIYTIDIDKCRRNILLHHKYDYRVFNVMDDVEVFYIKSKKIEGQFFLRLIIMFLYVGMVGIIIL